MKIALLIDDPGSNHDTYSYITSALIQGLHAKEQSVLIFRNRASIQVPFLTLRHNCRYYSFGLWKNPLHYLIAPLQMVWVLIKEGPDMVHVHLSGADFFGFSLVRVFYPVPYVVTFHGFNPRLSRWRHRLLRSLLEKASSVTAVSLSLAGSLEDAFPNLDHRIQVIPNGVDADRHREYGFRKNLLERFILSAGSLCFEKGTDLLLFAFHDLLKEKRVKGPLVLCGRDDLGAGFSDMIRRLGLGADVLFLGPCAHEEVLGLMRKCLFYVCPSRQESFGIAVVEAMAAGKAVVAPRTGGVPEHVIHEENGLLFAPGDVDDLKRCIERLYNNSTLRDRLGNSAENTASRFNWPEICRSYSELHSKALARLS